MTKTWAEVWDFRASIYGFLANSILEPIQEKQMITQNFWSNFPLDHANVHIQMGLEQLMICSSKLEVLSVDEALEKVMVEYTELFVGPGVPMAPPWESFYRTKDRLFFGATAFQMKDLLFKKGIESKTKNKKPEDHLGLELLFISILSEGFSNLEEDKLVSLIHEQISFMEKHLISWIGDLCKDAKEYGNLGFYAGLIELIWGVLLWDKELLEEFLISHKERSTSM